MSNIVIHFTDLDDLVQELHENTAGIIARVVVMDMTETSSSHGIRLAGIGVHVRAIDDTGCVLSCYIPVRFMQLVCTPQTAEDPNYAEYNAAWDKAEALADQVRDYLTKRNLCVRPGVIDLGEVRPLRGSWCNAPQSERNATTDHQAE
ncbi:MAG: hypothetical protein JW850_21800 [Thermoflexales bacterium]|nr:hypothetical protein [Thermoflexales bacterium]